MTFFWQKSLINKTFIPWSLLSNSLTVSFAEHHTMVHLVLVFHLTYAESEAWKARQGWVLSWLVVRLQGKFQKYRTFPRNAIWSRVQTQASSWIKKQKRPLVPPQWTSFVCLDQRESYKQYKKLVTTVLKCDFPTSLERWKDCDHLECFCLQVTYKFCLDWFKQ
jgi:hypothetical protein